jgi:hypothetical protein
VLVGETTFTADELPEPELEDPDPELDELEDDADVELLTSGAAGLI